MVIIPESLAINGGVTLISSSGRTVETRPFLWFLLVGGTLKPSAVELLGDEGVKREARGFGGNAEEPMPLSFHSLSSHVLLFTCLFSDTPFP